MGSKQVKWTSQPRQEHKKRARLAADSRNIKELKGGADGVVARKQRGKGKLEKKKKLTSRWRGANRLPQVTRNR